MPTYTVKANDNPSKIAEALYGDQRYFNVIQSAAGGAILQPGMRLKLPNANQLAPPGQHFVGAGDIWRANRNNRRLGNDRPEMQLTNQQLESLGMSPGNQVQGSMRRVGETSGGTAVSTARDLGGRLRQRIDPRELAARELGSNNFGSGVGTNRNIRDVTEDLPLTPVERLQAQQRMREESLARRLADLRDQPPSVSGRGASSRVPGRSRQTIQETALDALASSGISNSLGFRNVLQGEAPTQQPLAPAVQQGIDNLRQGGGPLGPLTVLTEPGEQRRSGGTRDPRDFGNGLQTPLGEGQASSQLQSPVAPGQASTGRATGGTAVNNRMGRNLQTGETTSTQGSTRPNTPGPSGPQPTTPAELSLANRQLIGQAMAMESGPQKDRALYVAFQRAWRDGDRMAQDVALETLADEVEAKLEAGIGVDSRIFSILRLRGYVQPTGGVQGINFSNGSGYSAYRGGGRGGGGSGINIPRVSQSRRGIAPRVPGVNRPQIRRDPFVNGRTASMGLVSWTI